MNFWHHLFRSAARAGSQYMRSRQNAHSKSEDDGVSQDILELLDQPLADYLASLKRCNSEVMMFSLLAPSEIAGAIDECVNAAADIMFHYSTALRDGMAKRFGKRPRKWYVDDETHREIFHDYFLPVAFDVLEHAMDQYMAAYRRAEPTGDLTLVVEHFKLISPAVQKFREKLVYRFRDGKRMVAATYH